MYNSEKKQFTNSLKEHIKGISRKVVNRGKGNVCEIENFFEEFKPEVFVSNDAERILEYRKQIRKQIKGVLKEFKKKRYSRHLFFQWTENYPCIESAYILFHDSKHYKLTVVWRSCNIEKMYDDIAIVKNIVESIFLTKKMTTISTFVVNLHFYTDYAE